MTERDFLDAIARAADDDLPRRAFADWLEEAGDPRAAWVRNEKIWPFMAPGAADPVSCLVDAAIDGGKPRELGGVLREIGPAAFRAFLPALKRDYENRPQRAGSPARPPPTDWILEALEPWLEKHRRPAWRAVVEDGDGPATVSKFRGTPWIGEGAPWPDCGSCRKPLQLFVQLDLGDLPAELGTAFGTGLLQLFYCTRDDCDADDGYETFARNQSRVRVVHSTGNTSIGGDPDAGERFPPRRIVGWERFVDLPTSEERYDLGLKLQDWWEIFEGVAGREWAEVIACEPGDKLAGWPCWVQGVEYPNCPRCGRRMIHVFQVDSNNNVPYMFGDVGCGHITQCPDHKEVVAFGWACH